jgi:hypothetical protein
MKTFGLFMLLFLIITIMLGQISLGCSSAEHIILSALFAYIMQQYITEETKYK